VSGWSYISYTRGPSRLLVVDRDARLDRRAHRLPLAVAPDHRRARLDLPCVNPVVAVSLGWALAGEPLSPLPLVAAVLLVTSPRQPFSQVVQEPAAAQAQVSISSARRAC